MYPREEIYIIAHLDGYLDNNPAADDDASGAASPLELARILSGRSFSRTVVLFFPTGEKHGSLGSRRDVADFPERLDAIKHLISVEMLRYDSNKDGAMELWTGTEDIEFVNRLAEIIANYQIGLNSEIFTDCY